MMPNRMSAPGLHLLLVLACLITAVFGSSVYRWTGVNLPSAAFDSSAIPGKDGFNYFWPPTTDIDYFTSQGMNIFRIAFLWERLQPSLNSSLTSTYLAELASIVNYITIEKQANALLDPHNYAKFNGSLIGSPKVPISAFTNFWIQLANEFKNNSRVIFGLMNEPCCGISTEQWATAAQAAINGIRDIAMASNVIFVPGTGYTGAWTWSPPENYYGTPNSVVMLNITDPLQNFVFEVHQYFDFDNSGTHCTCINTTIAQQKIESFTNWLRTNGKRGFLGEFAGGNNTICEAAIEGMMQYIKNNLDVWVGWTWWAGGPGWGSYCFSLEPKGGPANPVYLPILSQFLAVNTSSTSSSGGFDTVSSASKFMPFDFMDLNHLFGAMYTNMS